MTNRFTLPLALALVFSCTAPPRPSATLAISGADSIACAVPDPIPVDPFPPRIGIVVRQVAQLPKSEPVPPPTDQRLVRHARINQIWARSLTDPAASTCPT